MFDELLAHPGVEEISTLRSSFGRLEDSKTHVTQLNRLLLSTVETLATAIDVASADHAMVKLEGGSGGLVALGIEGLAH